MGKNKPTLESISNYEKNWKKHVEVNGVIDKDAVINELADFTFITNQYRALLSHTVGLSKLFYKSEAMIKEHDEKWLPKEFTQYEVGALILELEKGSIDQDEFVSGIKDLLDIDDNFMMIGAHAVEISKIVKKEMAKDNGK